MSQVFAGDGVMQTTAVTVVTTAETPCATGNFLNPPFGNAKALISASVSIIPGTGTTGITMRVRRNPNGENTLVFGTGAVVVAAGNVTLLSMQFVDPIPDGRPCQYQVTVQQTGATGNGSVNVATVSALLISG